MNTETPGSGPGSAPPPPPHLGAGRPRRLTRRPSEGHIAGVCAGVAHYFNLDPVIVRIAAAVLILSGPGVLAYILAWIFVPEATSDELSESYRAAPQSPFRPDRSGQVFGLILLSLSVIFLWGGWWSPVRRWGFPFALLALGIWLIFRRVGDRDEPVEWTEGPPPAAPAADVTDADPSITEETDLIEPELTTDADPTQQVPPWQAGDGSHVSRHSWAPHLPVHHRRELTDEERATRRRRRMVFPTVMGALLMWAGVTALAGIGLQASLAVALCIVGLGFVLGAVMGGGKLLIFPALVLGAALIATSALDLPLDGPMGKRHREPAVVADLDAPFQVSLGEQVIDLTRLDFGDQDEVTLTASVGIGHLEIRVPDDVELVIDATVEMGEINVLGAAQNGVGVEWSRRVDLGSSTRTINLDLEHGIGKTEIILDESASEPLR